MAAPAVADGRPVIVCFGDSITAGLGVDPAVNYPADLQGDLDQAGYRYRVVNLGISGETTKDGLERVEDVLALKPFVVLVEFGGNDGLRGLPIEASQKNLTQMVNQLRKGGTKVVVAAITLPPQYGEDYLRKFGAIFPAVTRATGVLLIPFAQLAKGVYGVDGMLQEDGIHPTAAGDAGLAKNVATVLAPMLKR
jgi:acyl-CoA thioesterase-1